MVREKLKKQLEETLYVHYPMALDESKTLEKAQRKKEVLEEENMWNGDAGLWKTVGIGSVSFWEDGLELVTNAREEFWQANESQTGTYSTFGDYTAFLDVSDRDWSGYSQIVFDILPECEGLHSPMIRVGYENDGVLKIPDAYTREGFNAISLKNGEWNRCVWDISELPHDKMTRVLFRVHKYGKELSAGDVLKYTIRNIRMQKVGRPNVTKGWICEANTISYSTSGYFKEGKKTAVANVDAELFYLCEASNDAVVLEKKISTVENERGRFQVLDFSEICREGCYYLKAGDAKTEPFAIDGHLLESASWKLINFLFCERCGFPVPNKHGSCHYDAVASHNGVKMVFNGGWHDAADVSQQTTQTAEVAEALMQLADRVRDNRPLYLRLMEEANWGMDFVLRTRFGDGYRATHSLMRRWSDNLIGNFDDIDDVRVHNNAFDNFIISGVEATACGAFEGMDRELAWKCREVAKEDFAFAEEVFLTKGIQRPTRGEHTLNASMSQHYAVAAWAAAGIYRICAESVYADKAADYLNRMLACQDRGETGTGLKGFFYRDESKKAIVHFNHQSREHVFAQALTAVCGAVREHPDRDGWLEAMALHGAYYKKLMAYTQPYGMIPAGIYSMEELEDEETFRLLHPRLDFEVEKLNYLEQLKSAYRLNETYCVRRFPVWFSFRGNSAVVLSMGKAATLIGTYLQDEELIGIGREQAYWMLGKNPFGQSMIYGEGCNYAKQYTALCGDTVGEMPVGVETRGNEDVPYWPMGNIATYKEIWASAAGHFLWLAADIY